MGIPFVWCVPVSDWLFAAGTLTVEDEFLDGGLLPIERDANGLLLAIGQCVRNFQPYHKYQIRSDLRRHPVALSRLAQRAWRGRAQQLEHVSRMIWQVDEIKLSLQLAKSVQAIASFAQRQSDFSFLTSKGFFMNLPLLFQLKSAFDLRNAAALLCSLLAASAMAQQSCNPNVPLKRPDSRYEAVAGALPAGSEVRDKVTGLIWQRCLLGKSWNGTACTGTTTPLTWTQALDSARLATPTAASPASAWRLPNRNELQSLVETACYYPAINATWFPDVPAYGGFDSWMWSASTLAFNAGGAWGVDFGVGWDYDIDKSLGIISARLVRSGQ